MVPVTTDLAGVLCFCPSVSRLLQDPTRDVTVCLVISLSSPAVGDISLGPSLSFMTLTRLKRARVPVSYFEKRSSTWDCLRIFS